MKDRRIAVVGNGGLSQEDVAELNTYDQHKDVVIRFNNFNARHGITFTKNPDHCDILFTTFDLATPGVCPDDVVIGIPFPFHQERIRDISSRWYPKSQMHMVNPYMNAEMCDELRCGTDGTKHPFPSIGFTCLWHLHQMGISDFKLFGFNWYSDLKNETIQGHKMGQKVYPKNWNHNYPKELEWIIRNLTNKFSTNCKKVIDMAAKQLGI